MFVIIHGFLILFLIFFHGETNAHEPLFGLGPELIRKGGYAIEGAIEYERAGDEKEMEIDTDIMYGVNEKLAVSVTMPFFLNVEERDTETGDIKKSASLGKIETRAKYLIYKNYDYGKRDQAVLIGGVRWPTVSFDKDPFLENRAIDFILAIAIGREMLRNSYFGTLAYVIKTRANGRKDGDEFTLTLAAGFRPEPVSYYNLDWLFFLEFDGVFTMKDKVNCMTDENSGGIVFYIGPTVFVSKKNILVKAGIQAPFIEKFNGCQNKHDYRLAVGLDLHF